MDGREAGRKGGMGGGTDLCALAVDALPELTPAVVQEDAAVLVHVQRRLRTRRDWRGGRGE